MRTERSRASIMVVFIQHVTNLQLEVGRRHGPSSEMRARPSGSGTRDDAGNSPERLNRLDDNDRAVTVT